MGAPRGCRILRAGVGGSRDPAGEPVDAEQGFDIRLDLRTVAGPARRSRRALSACVQPEPPRRADERRPPTRPGLRRHDRSMHGGLGRRLTTGLRPGARAPVIAGRLGDFQALPASCDQFFSRTGSTSSARRSCANCVDQTTDNLSALPSDWALEKFRNRCHHHRVRPPQLPRS